MARQAFPSRRSGRGVYRQPWRARRRPPQYLQELFSGFPYTRIARAVADGGPIQTAADDFNRADATPSPTALGANWSTTGDGLGISSNRVCGSGSSSTSWGAHVTPTTTDHQYVQASVAVLPTDQIRLLLALATSPSALLGPTFVFVKVDSIGQVNVGLKSPTTTATGSAFATIVAGDVVRAEMLARVVSVYVNGVLAGSQDLVALGTGQGVALLAGQRRVGIQITDGTGRADNFAFGDMGVTADIALTATTYPRAVADTAPATDVGAISAPTVGTILLGNVAGATALSAAPDISFAPTGQVAFVGGLLEDTLTAPVTLPSGWSLVTNGEGSEGTSGGAGSHSFLAWRVKQAGDTTFTFSWDVSGKYQLIPFTYPGVDPTNPVDVAAYSASTTSSTVVSASITPSTATKWIIGLFGKRGTTAAMALTPDAALTERAEADTSATRFISLELADTNGAVTQAAHSYTATVTGSTASHGGSIVAALSPVASGVSRTLSQSRSISDTAAATDSVTRVRNLVRAVADGGPTQLAADDFNRADTSTSGTFGTGWSFPFSNPGGFLVVKTNQATNSTSNSSRALAVRSETWASDAGFVQIRVGTGGVPAGQGLRIYLSLPSGGGDLFAPGVRFAMLEATSNTLTLADFNAGTQQNSASASFSLAAGDLMRVERQGATYLLYVNGVLKVTFTPAFTITGQTLVGVGLLDAAGAQTTALDDFSMGTLGITTEVVTRSLSLPRYLADSGAGNVALGNGGSNNLDSLAFGNNASTASLEVQFTLASLTTLQAATLMLSRSGTPADNLVLEIASTVSGTAVATATAVSGSTVSGPPKDLRFTFSSPPSLSAGTYYLRLSRSGAADAANFYLWTAGYQSLPFYTYNGSSWTQDVPTTLLQSLSFALLTGEMDTDTRALAEARAVFDSTLPTVFDAFDRADGGLGANWTTTANLAISGNGLYSSSGTSAGTYLASLAADQFAQAQLNPGTVTWGVLARVQGNPTTIATLNGYLFVRTASTGDLVLYKVVSGATTQLGITVRALPNSSRTEVLRLEVTGSSLTCYVNGVSTISTTDSTYAAGNAGVYLGQSTASNQVDNFYAGSLVVADTVTRVVSFPRAIADSAPATDTVTGTVSGGVVAGSAALTQASTLTTSALVTEVASAALTQVSTLTTTAIVTAIAFASFTQASTLTATGEVIKVGAAALTQAQTLTTTALVTDVATVALTQATTLTTTALVTEIASASLAQASTLTTTGVVTKVGDAALTQAQTLTATALVTDVASVALTQPTTLTATALVTEIASAALTQASTLTTAGVVTKLGSAALTQAQTLTTTALVTDVASVALTQAQTLTIVELVKEVASAALTQPSTLTTVGVVTKLGTASLSSTSTLVSTGVITRVGSASLTGTSTLTASTLVTVIASAALTTTSTLTTTGVVTKLGTAALTQASVLTATAIAASGSIATLTQPSTLTTTASVTDVATAALSSASTLTTSALVTDVASASLTQASTLTTSATLTRLGVVALTQTSTLATSATVTDVASAALSSTSTLTGSATLSRIGVANLTSTSFMLLDDVYYDVYTDSYTNVIFVTEVAATALTQSSTLTTTATRTAVAAASLTQASTLAASVNGNILSGSADLVETSTLTTAATRTVAGVVALSETSSLTVAGTNTVFGVVALTETSALTISATATVAAAASLAESSTLTTTGDVIKLGAAELTEVSSLATTGTVSIFGFAALIATSILTVPGTTAPPAVYRDIEFVVSAPFIMWRLGPPATVLKASPPVPVLRAAGPTSRSVL